MGLDMYAYTIDSNLIDEEWETDCPVYKFARRAVGFIDLTDDEVDNLNRQVFRELVSFMIEDPRTITRATRRAPRATDSAWPRAAGSIRCSSSICRASIRG